MRAAPTVISAKNLTKRFGKFKALNNLNLEVQQGEVHGFLGPNGSGKSTTIRVLLGLLKKSSGEVTMLSKDPWHDSVALHKHLAYVPGDVNLWPNLSGGEVIDLFMSLRGSINKTAKQQLLEDFQLDPKKKCRTYSKGNRQKVALIAALASDAEVYILDEPTSGLDPLMESVFQTHVHKLKKANKTVLLSSHILAEVEALADRVTIIREGRTVESGTLTELRHLSRSTVHVHTKLPIRGLEKIEGLYDLKLEEKYASFDIDHNAIGEVLTHLAQFEIQGLTSTPPTLEELFMRHYNNDPRG